jgi:hypothetical protein
MDLLAAGVPDSPRRTKTPRPGVTRGKSLARWPKRTTEADGEPALEITDMDTLERFPRVWCDTCEKTQPMIFDVMQASARATCREDPSMYSSPPKRL